MFLSNISDGTTDITRTVHFGYPTAEEKDGYTRVLLGNLDLEQVVWPKSNKISGWDLDVLARRRLWEAGLDYSHGTGHGIGYFLGVHEGPYGVSRRITDPFEPGVVVSNGSSFEII